jgi:broad specificity phosphatase PhoE
MFPHALCILRHGQTEWNAIDRMQGRLNSPLTALGHQQAARQRQILDGLDLTGWAAFVSPQGRAVQTAAIALAGIADTIRTDDRLCEIDVGDWNGVLRADVMAAQPELFDGDDGLDWYDHAPGGEGYGSLEARCRAFLGDLTGPTVIVAHGITSRMLRCLALDIAPEALSTLPGGQGNVYHLVNGTAVELT